MEGEFATGGRRAECTNRNRGRGRRMKQATRVVVILVAFATTAIAGDKRTGETCVEDNECSRGHCHTKKDGAKVCVDCSASDISDYRGQIEKFCKSEPRQEELLGHLDRAGDSVAATRLSNGERCITARD